MPPCCLQGVDLVNDDLTKAQATAAQFALEHRLDLMNVRGQVVDAWRQLAVYANALLGVFNVGYNLDASSPAMAAQPLNIGGSATTNQLTLNTQLPLVRIQQRNNYRASQIAYTRQRRALQEAEDITVQLVYAEIYNLRLFVEQYKVQKRLLELAYVTIDSSLESLQAPTAPLARVVAAAVRTVPQPSPSSSWPPNAPCPRRKTACWPSGLTTSICACSFIAIWSSCPWMRVACGSIRSRSANARPPPSRRKLGPKRRKAHRQHLPETLRGAAEAARGTAAPARNCPNRKNPQRRQSCPNQEKQPAPPKLPEQEKQPALPKLPEPPKLPQALNQAEPPKESETQIPLELYLPPPKVDGKTEPRPFE